MKMFAKVHPLQVSVEARTSSSIGNPVEAPPLEVPVEAPPLQVPVEALPMEGIVQILPLEIYRKT